MSFLGEIKRRKVLRVAAVYAVVAWLIIQVAGQIASPLGLPEWFETFVIVLLGIGTFRRGMQSECGRTTAER